MRHRVFSFAQESQRYCNYSKDKFGKEVTFIIPTWADLKEGHYPITWNGLIGDYMEGITDNPESLKLFWSLAVAERDYTNLINDGLNPQQARAVLPNATKTEILLTGFSSDWEHFFFLRALGKTGKPHPDMQALAMPLMEEFIKRGYIRDIRDCNSA